MAVEKHLAKHKKSKQSDKYSKKAYSPTNHAHVAYQKPAFTWLIVGGIGKW